MTAVSVLDSGILPPKKAQIQTKNQFERKTTKWKIRTKYQSDFVVNERIEEFLLSLKAFFRDMYTVLITQLRAFGFSAVIYNTWSRRSGTRRTAYLTIRRQCAVERGGGASYVRIVAG